ncbi:Nucleolar protein 9 [Savitreella phatthalungensis]
MPRERKQRGRRKRKDDDVAQPEPEIDPGPVSSEIQSEHGNEDEFFGFLDENEQAYFREVDEKLAADEFTSSEESGLFVTNVLKEAENKELKLATSPLGSKVLEQLMARSRPEQIKALCAAFAGKFLILVRHRYASHVCEMLLAIMASLVDREMTGELSEAPSYKTTFLSILAEMEPHLLDLAGEHYGSHVARDMLLALDGSLFTFNSAQKRSKRYHGQKKYLWARPNRNVSTPATFKKAAMRIARMIRETDNVQLRVLASAPHSMGFVQAAISLDPSVALPLFEAGSSESGRADFVEAMMRESAGSQIIETAVCSMDDQMLENFAATYLKGRIARFAHNDVSNHILQTWLGRTTDLAAVEAAWAELAPVVADVLDVNHLTVLQAMIESLLRHGAEPLAQNVWLTVCAVRPPKQLLKGEEGQFSIQGAFLLSACLGISQRVHDEIVEMLVEYSPATDLAKSSCSLKLMSAVFQHSSTDIPQCRRLLNKFGTSWSDLARDKDGSFFLDAVRALCIERPQLKLIAQRIAQDLTCNGGEELRADFYGRIVWRNWRLDVYRHRRGEWERDFRSHHPPKTLKPAQPASAVAPLTMHPDRLARQQETQPRQQKRKRAPESAGAARQVAAEVDALFARKR